MLRTRHLRNREEDILNRRQSKGRFSRSQALKVKLELRRLSV